MKKNFFSTTAYAVVVFMAAIFMGACDQFAAIEEVGPQPIKEVPGPVVHDTLYLDKLVYLPGDTIIRETEKEVRVEITLYKDYRLEVMNGFGFAYATITNPDGDVVRSLSVTYLNKVVTLQDSTELGKTGYLGVSETTHRFLPHQEAYASEDITWEKDHCDFLDPNYVSVTGIFSKTVSIKTDNGEIEIPVMMRPSYLQVVPKTITVTNEVKVEVHDTTSVQVINNVNVYVNHTYYVTRESHLGWGKVTVTDSIGNTIHEWTVRYDKPQVLVPAKELGTSRLTSANASPWTFMPGDQSATATHSGQGTFGPNKWEKDTFTKVDDEIYLVEGTFNSSVTLTTKAGSLIIPLTLNASYLQHTEAVTPVNVDVDAKVTNGEGFSTLTFTQKGGKKMSEFNLKLDSVLIHRASVSDLTQVDLLSEANMVATFTGNQRSVGSSSGDSVVYQSCKFVRREFSETTSTSSVNGYVTTTTYTNRVTLFFKVTGYILHRDGSKQEFSYELAPWYTQMAIVRKDETPDKETYTVDVEISKVDDHAEKASVSITGSKGYSLSFTTRCEYAVPSPKSDFIVANLTPVAIVDSTWTVEDEPTTLKSGLVRHGFTHYIQHDVKFVNAAGGIVGPGTTVSAWGTNASIVLPSGELFTFVCNISVNIEDSYTPETGVADWTLSDGRVAKYATTMKQTTTGFTEYNYTLGDKSVVCQPKKQVGEDSITMKMFLCTEK